MKELQENLREDFLQRIKNLDVERLRSIYKEEFATEDDYNDFGEAADKAELIEDLVGLRELVIEEITTQAGYDTAIR